MSNHGCFGGWIVEFEENGPRTVGRCEICALRQFADQTGRSDCTWETWGDVAELRRSVASLRGWKGQTWSALMHAAPGKPNFGSGKSHAVNAVGQQWIKDGREVKYLVAAEFADLHRQAMFHSTIPTPAHGDFSGLFILDDLGSEARTDWTRELVDRIFDQRYRRGLPTLVTTNLDPSAIEERYPRLMSRFCEGLQLIWDAPDRRRRSS